MYHPFSVTETINIAWKVFKRNFAVITVYMLLAVIIFFAFGFAAKFMVVDVVWEFILGIIATLAISFVFLGFIKLVFQLLDKEYYEFDFSDITPKIKMLASYVVLLIIVSTLAVFVSNAIEKLDDGMFKYLLGIVSGLLIEVFFLFYFPLCACFIVDDSSGPFESVIQSFQLIRGNFWKYFMLFLFIEILVLIASFTIIGLLFVVPFVNILLAIAYRKLIYSHQDVDENISEML